MRNAQEEEMLISLLPGDVEEISQLEFAAVAYVKLLTAHFI